MFMFATASSTYTLFFFFFKDLKHSHLFILSHKTENQFVKFPKYSQSTFYMGKIDSLSNSVLILKNVVTAC